MKTLLSILLMALALTGTFTKLNGQCDGRYLEEVFASVDVTTVTYSDSFNLEMDIYQPTGDTLVQRPLIIFAHGGSYIAGTKTNPTMVELCNAFARRGYVTASMQYRLGSGIFALLDSLNAADIVIKSVGDMKAAVRFFRKDADGPDMYRIDPSEVYVGGNSAGAVTSVHMAYIDSIGELPAHLQTIMNNNGGIEGNSGNPGYSSEVKAVVNLAGAINQVAWIDANDEPIVSAHGNEDKTVPYECGQPLESLTSSFPGTIDIIDLCGSGPIDERADQLNVISSLMTFEGYDHVPWGSDAVLMDTVITYVAEFLYQQLSCSNTGNFSLADVTYGAQDTVDNPPTAIVKPLEVEGFEVYPNPVDEFVVIDQIDFGNEPYHLYIIDQLGRMVHSESNLLSTRWSKDMSAFGTGMYLIRLENSRDASQSKTVKIYFN